MRETASTEYAVLQLEVSLRNGLHIQSEVATLIAANAESPPRKPNCRLQGAV